MLYYDVLIKRAASPGAVSFVQFYKDRYRSKNHTALIVLRYFKPITLYIFGGGNFVLMRGKIPSQ
jgi:hypothetical protein